MGPKRQQILLLILGATCVVAGYMWWPAGQASQAAPAAAPREAGRAAALLAGTNVPDVRLEALAEDRPEPGTSERNLFKFKPKPAPPPPVAPRPVVVAPPMPSGPPPPPPIPPIGLKFIGVVEPGSGPRIAILSDGRGSPIYGREGESVLGQYKIVRIGTESIDMMYLDGRGRQTIRLSGS